MKNQKNEYTTFSACLIKNINITISPHPFSTISLACAIYDPHNVSATSSNVNAENWWENHNSHSHSIGGTAMYEDIHPASSIRSSHSPPLLHHHQQINQIDQLPETESQLHSQSNHIKHQTANSSTIQSNQSNTVASSQTQIVASSTASESPASIQSQTTGN